MRSKFHFKAFAAVAAAGGAYGWGITHTPRSVHSAATISESKANASTLGGGDLLNVKTIPALSKSFSDDLSLPMSKRMEALVRHLQSKIVAELEIIDGSKFHVDSWKREQGGGGTSCVLQDGRVFEKAGVNVSVVSGTLSEAMAKQMRSRGKPIPVESHSSYFATGLSIVLHPHNPMAPTVHLNYRYFEVRNNENQMVTWWFGGGSDLTPSYLFTEDAVHFHQTLKSACDTHDSHYYPKFKEWCDVYFHIPHRQECRGIGGIFFDDFEGEGAERSFAFVKSCADAFLPSYLPILNRRYSMPHDENQKQWQQIRRGRYVEFNLVHDRGTKFGLATPGARIESILMSLPLTARWEYAHEPAEGSWEHQLLDVTRSPRTWIATPSKTVQ